MRVTIAGESTAWGGTEIYTSTLAVALTQRGHDVTILMLGDAVFTGDRVPEGVSVVHRPAGGDIGTLPWRDQARILSECDADVGVLMKNWFYVGNWRLDMIARLRWRRYYFVEHSASPPPPQLEWRYYFGRRVPDFGFGRRKLRLSLRIRSAISHKTIAVSSEVGARLVQNYSYPAHSVETIANGIDTTRFVFDREIRDEIRSEWGVPSRAFVFGAVGRLSPEKKLERAVLAIAECGRLVTDRELYFVAAGDGPEEAALRGLASSLGLERNVRFVGFHPRPERVYCGLDAFMLTSDVEGLPLSLCEAMSIGLPSIATDAPGCGEIVNAASLGRVVPRGDNRALLEAMTWAISMTPDERARLAVAARSRIVASFDARRQVQRVVELIETGR